MRSYSPPFQCRCCGKPAHYSVADVVDIHTDGSYFCDDSRTTSATPYSYPQETWGEKKKRELSERIGWAD